MVPLTFFKSTILYMRAKLKSTLCKLSLMKSQNKATDVLNTNYITWFKSFFKKSAHLRCPSCLTMSVEETPSKGLAVTRGRLFHPEWGHVLRTWNHWLHLKDLGSKNLTCKSLSIALILWDFIEMLAMKSEPIFLAF